MNIIALFSYQTIVVVYLKLGYMTSSECYLNFHDE